MHLVRYLVFPIVGGRACFFYPPPPPSELMPLMGCTSHLKMKFLPSEKQLPPPWKSEAPFHEMIPGKSTVNNNLKLVSAIYLNSLHI